MNNGLLAPVWREFERVKMLMGNVIRRGVFTLVQDSYFTQVEAFEGERYDDVELWQQYGLASRPPVGGEVLLAKPGNRGEGAIAFATTDRAHRPRSLADGDTVLYAKSGTGQAQVHAKADGDVDCTPGTGKTINVGGTAAACVDYLLKGTTHDTATRTLVTALGVGFTAVGTGFTAVGTAMTALGSDAALATATKDACNTCATAMGTAATACTTAAAACTAWLAGSYLATKGKVC